MKHILALVLTLSSSFAFSLTNFAFDCRTYDDYPKVFTSVQMKSSPCENDPGPFPCSEVEGTLTIDTMDNYDYTPDYHDQVRIVLGKDFSKDIVSTHPEVQEAGRTYLLITYFEILRKEGKSPGELKVFLGAEHQFRKPITYQVLCERK